MTAYILHFRAFVESQRACSFAHERTHQRMCQPNTRLRGPKLMLCTHSPLVTSLHDCAKPLICTASCAGTDNNNAVARALKYAGRRHARQRRRTLNVLAASSEDLVQACIVTGTHPHAGALPQNAAADTEALLQLLQKRGLKVRCCLGDGMWKAGAAGTPAACMTFTREVFTPGTLLCFRRTASHCRLDKRWVHPPLWQPSWRSCLMAGSCLGLGHGHA